MCLVSLLRANVILFLYSASPSAPISAHSDDNPPTMNGVMMDLGHSGSSSHLDQYQLDLKTETARIPEGSSHGFTHLAPTKRKRGRPRKSTSTMIPNPHQVAIGMSRITGLNSPKHHLINKHGGRASLPISGSSMACPSPCASYGTKREELFTSFKKSRISSQNACYPVKQPSRPHTPVNDAVDSINSPKSSFPGVSYGFCAPQETTKCSEFTVSNSVVCAPSTIEYTTQTSLPCTISDLSPHSPMPSLTLANKDDTNAPSTCSHPSSPSIIDNQAQCFANLVHPQPIASACTNGSSLALSPLVSITGIPVSVACNSELTGTEANSTHHYTASNGMDCLLSRPGSSGLSDIDLSILSGGVYKQLSSPLFPNLSVPGPTIFQNFPLYTNGFLGHQSMAAVAASDASNVALINRLLPQATAAVRAAKAAGLKGPHTWNPQTVANFIATMPGCRALSQKFIDNEIDGAALLCLEQHDLMHVMGIKLGPAVKVYSAIQTLRRNLLATPLPELNAEQRQAASMVAACFADSSPVCEVDLTTDSDDQTSCCTTQPLRDPDATQTSPVTSNSNSPTDLQSGKLALSLSSETHAHVGSKHRSTVISRRGSGKSQARISSTSLPLTAKAEVPEATVAPVTSTLPPSPRLTISFN